MSYRLQNNIFCFTQVINPESLQPATHTNTHTCCCMILISSFLFVNLKQDYRCLRGCNNQADEQWQATYKQWHPDLRAETAEQKTICS